MKHASPEFAEIAEKGTVLQCQVGSGVHGITVSDQDDRDEMGICVEPPEYVMGLRGFEQYVYRSQPEGVRSGPGDLDLTVYALRKWMRLALDGNPTVLLPLFVPEEEIVRIDLLGRELRELSERILSRRVGDRCLGYLRSQRDSLLGRRSGRRTNRPELIDVYGFDTKFAYHMVRLGVQGAEILESGRLTLPMPDPWATWLRELRRGEHTLEEALEAAAEQEARLERLVTTSPLPARPDRDWADAWLVEAHRRHWAERGL
ncbi:nucleotidyltransferase domain-containing protein [Nocardiopsis chromatogenes]|uniref:nucleotidyltransferase domain-containing protein n=1 Tax=Nocardiopsis chromatogenes TaxID=280239 RepID=UPI00034D7D51|nr:nucleotidyltransferase domain-containing protein [Nocardiopsis chromatogenes]